MQYKGKLYGKVGGEYFDTGRTTDDWDELEASADQVDAIVMRKDQVIQRLRGQIQNCVNHLERAKNRTGNRYDYDDVIDSANKAIYETLDA